MKKRTKLVLISQDQMKREPWRAFAQIQQKAKSGVTTSVGLYGNVVEDIADADPLRATAGAVTVEALRAAIEPQFVCIKINANEADAVPIRKVHVDSGDNMGVSAAAVDAVAGTTLVANLTFDNGSKNNDSVTNAVADGTLSSAFINAKLATRKPSFSLSALVNMLEDVAIDQDVRFEVLFSQGDNGGLGRIKVFQVDTEAHLETAHAASNAVATADFEVDTTPQAASEKLAGE